MELKYALYPNPLTLDPNDCRAIIQNRKIITWDELIKRKTSRGLTLTDTEVKSVMNEESHAIIEFLLDGYTIVTPLVTIKPTIRGKFNDSDDTFDPERHSIEFNAKLGKDLKLDTSNMKVQKVKATIKSPMILEVEDHFSETQNERITPNGTLNIRGVDLKLNTSAEDEGLYFKFDGTTQKAEKYFSNTNSSLLIKVPNILAEGSSCTLEVRKRYKDNKQLYKFVYDIDLLIGN
ncbi:DUF4469 domain-containing protein [Marinilabiliaceae bacterium JC017]|nr:DUF4469 domain-containing protein [Marinilabiliaceae bacterium JC017]